MQRRRRGRDAAPDTFVLAADGGLAKKKRITIQQPLAGPKPPRALLPDEKPFAICPRAVKAKGS